MKRLMGLALLTLLLVLLALAGGVGRGAAESGPACADITGETHNYTRNATTGTGTLGVQLLLRSSGNAPCKQVTYSLYVVTDPGGVPSSPYTWNGTTLGSDGGPAIVAPISDDDDTVYVYATTSIGGRTFDLAPDTATTNCDASGTSNTCLDITSGTTGGQGTFN